MSKRFVLTISPPPPSRRAFLRVCVSSFRTMRFTTTMISCSTKRPVFCHSCESNCMYSFKGEDIVVRAITTVEAGEELTLDYNRVRRLEPTHLRRFKWQNGKDFTCHCPRCVAEGDDTRQFNCFDRNCAGCHLVCQPISLDPLEIPANHYTGVEYVEPHLLPCTACQRSPPSEYQTAMFALEEKWAAKLKELPATPGEANFLMNLCTDVHGKMVQVVDTPSIPPTSTLPGHLVDLERLQYQVCHWLGWQLGLKELLMRAALSQVNHGPLHSVRAQRLIVDVDAVISGEPHCRPRDEALVHLFELWSVYVHRGDTANAERWRRKIIRWERILNGRDTSGATERVMTTMQKFLAVGAGRRGTGDGGGTAGCSAGVGGELSAGAGARERCTYCEESPALVEMALLRCGACRQVIYCGMACQKAHWPAHKKECRKG